jgi:hypothetical protein
MATIAKDGSEEFCIAGAHFAGEKIQHIEKNKDRSYG